MTDAEFIEEIKAHLKLFNKIEIYQNIPGGDAMVRCLPKDVESITRTLLIHYKVVYQAVRVAGLGVNYYVIPIKNPNKQE